MMIDPSPRAPSDALASAEFARSSLEFSSLLLSAPLLRNAPRGDGHDVLLIPGFGLGDQSTLPMRRYLQRLGYRAHGWELGRNSGAREIVRTGERIADRVAAIAKRSGGAISLVGHSLGGVMARRFAIAFPEQVRQVISLGSPFVCDPRAVNNTVSRLFERHALDPADADYAGEPYPLPVPSTAIFSHSDGIVSASDCTQVESDTAENIEVYGSHCGLIVNATVFYAVADRLARPVGQTTAFNPTGWRRFLYGRAA